jgi:hypothetical protein
VRIALLACALALAVHAARAVCGTPGPQARSVALSGELDSRQIDWQRSFDDALALARAQGRALLLVLNMDGESASDRIVVERYRDPAFVAGTRPFVCLVGSAFRHAPRDRDEKGRRVTCPRLGQITCGEHQALEEILFERMLGGERVAPRHALVELDGRKRFDLFLLFDLRQLDSALREAAASAPPALEAKRTEAVSWSELARGRSNRERTALEAALAAAPAAQWESALAALERGGDRGSASALEMLLELDARLGPRAIRCAWSLGCAAELGLSAWERARGQAGVQAESLAHWVERLGELAPALEAAPRPVGGQAAARAARTLLFARAALGPPPVQRAAMRALEGLLGDAEAASAEAALSEAGGPFDPLAWIERAPPPSEEIPGQAPAQDWAVLLADLDTQLARIGPDARTELERVRALLEWGRARESTSRGSGELSFQDAERALARLEERGALAGELAFDGALLAARSAHLLGRFEAVERAAARALALATDPTDPRRVEALRWLGDSQARLLRSRAGAGAERELTGIFRGARALFEVLLSAQARAIDWESAASFARAVGLLDVYERTALEALRRWPDSDALRALVNGDLWGGTRTAAIEAAYAELAQVHPRSAACAWYAGYASLARAEQHRRAQEHEPALEAYDRSERAFERATELEPRFGDSARVYRALAALGLGHSRLLAEDRAGAAAELLRAAGSREGLWEARDGLGRDVWDLVDGCLEWRESGPSPVDPRELCQALLEVDPDARWADAVSDACLREAQRAMGRGEPDLAQPLASAAVECARRARELEPTQERQRNLAQMLCVAVENHPRGVQLDSLRALLAEAARLLGRNAPAPATALDPAALRAWEDLAVELRSDLGPARPRVRPGR